MNELRQRRNIHNDESESILVEEQLIDNDNLRQEFEDQSIISSVDDEEDETTKSQSSEECETIEKRDFQNKTCRICFDSNPEDELFRPCRCKGTMMYVHINCLNAWRQSSRNSESSFKCDQCHYEYRVGSIADKIFYVRVLRSTLFVEIASLVILFVAVFLGGFAVKLFYCESYSLLFIIDVQHFYLGSSLVGFGALASAMVASWFHGLRLLEFGRFRDFKWGGAGNVDMMIKSVIIVAGLAYALYKIYNWLKDTVKAHLMLFSQSILDIPPEDLDDL